MGNSHNKNIISIHPLPEQDVESAISLHISLIQSAGSILGKTYLRTMYTQMIRYPEYHFMLGAYDGNQLIGALLATRSIGFTNTLLRHTSMLHIPNIVWGIVSRTILTSELVSHASVHAYISKLLHKHGIYVTALYVVQSHQRRGIATQLIQKLQKISSAKEVFIDTHTHNVGALKVYESIGFDHVKRIGPHDILRWECI